MLKRLFSNPLKKKKNSISVTSSSSDSTIDFTTLRVNLDKIIYEINTNNFILYEKIKDFNNNFPYKVTDIEFNKYEITKL